MKPRHHRAYHAPPTCHHLSLFCQIVMDDCWSDTKRNATGHLLPAASQFPNGMGPLADYVHSKGLKFGLYTCVGTQTCHGGRPGSYGNFDIDAQTVAGKGVALSVFAL